MNTLKKYIKRETKPDLYYKAPYNEEAYDNLSDYVDCSRNYKGIILASYIPHICRYKYWLTLSGYVSYIGDHCNLYKSINDNRSHKLQWHVGVSELMRMYDAM